MTTHDITDIETAHCDAQGITEALQANAAHGAIYTAMGVNLIVVNTGQQQHQLGALEGPSPTKLAQTVRAAVTSGVECQTILHIGDSGTGKTTSMLEELKTLVEGGSKDGQLIERVTKAFKFLGAFGNASTLDNKASTRHGLAVEIHFGSDDLICNVTLEAFCLDTTRATQHADSRQLYKCFEAFQECAVDQAVDFHHFVRTLPHAQDFMTDAQLREVFQILKTIYESRGQAGWPGMATVEQLFIVDQPGSDSIDEEGLVTFQRGAYQLVFNAVIATINEKLSPIGVGTICEDEGRVVRLIDIAGFERRASAQDSLTQFLFNGINELVQYHANADIVFRSTSQESEQDQPESPFILPMPLSHQAASRLADLIGDASILQPDLEACLEFQQMFKAVFQHDKTSNLGKLEHYAGSIEYDFARLVRMDDCPSMKQIKEGMKRSSNKVLSGAPFFPIKPTSTLKEDKNKIDDWMTDTDELYVVRCFKLEGMEGQVKASGMETYMGYLKSVYAKTYDLASFCRLHAKLLPISPPTVAHVRDLVKQVQSRLPAPGDKSVVEPLVVHLTRDVHDRLNFENNLASSKTSTRFNFQTMLENNDSPNETLGILEAHAAESANFSQKISSLRSEAAVTAATVTQLRSENERKAETLKCEQVKTKSMEQELENVRSDLQDSREAHGRDKKSLEDKISREREKHEAELSNLTESHRQVIEAAQETHRAELSRLRESHRQVTEAAQETHQVELSDLRESHRQATEAAQDKLNTEKALGASTEELTISLASRLISQGRFPAQSSHYLQQVEETVRDISNAWIAARFLPEDQRDGEIIRSISNRGKANLPFVAIPTLAMIERFVTQPINRKSIDDLFPLHSDMSSHLSERIASETIDSAKRNYDILTMERLQAELNPIFDASRILNNPEALVKAPFVRIMAHLVRDNASFPQLTVANMTSQFPGWAAEKIPFRCTWTEIERAARGASMPV